MCVRTRRIQTCSEYEASTLLLRNCDKLLARTDIMRAHRIFQAINSSVISAHLMSRALDRRMILDDIAKDRFRQLLAQQCALSKIELVTFCLMGM